MGKLERQFLSTQERAPLVWWRYIDDSFAVWTYGESALQSFGDELNGYHSIIKFVANWSTKEVGFFRHADVSEEWPWWKPIFISSQLTFANIYRRTVAILGTVKLPFPTDKLYAYAEFALNRITSVSDVMN